MVTPRAGGDLYSDGKTVGIASVWDHDRGLAGEAECQGVGEGDISLANPDCSALGCGKEHQVEVGHESGKAATKTSPTKSELL